MAHFTFIAHGLTSPLNTSLELSRRLSEAGHRVSYVSHADIGAEVTQHGFAFVQLTENQAIRKSMLTSLGLNPLTWLRKMRRARASSLNSDEIEQVVADLAPDMLLIDIEMHYPIIATASLGIPTMLVMNFLSTFRLPDLPPLNTVLMPGDSKAIDRAWRKVQLAAHGARLRHKIGKGGLGDVLRPVSYGTRHYADLKLVARVRGYKLDENVDRRQWLRPFMYTKLPILCLNAWELEFPHQPHPNIRYVGPMVNRQRPESRVSGDDARRWKDYKRKRSEASSPRPLIYCSLGSYWTDPGFLRMVLATFERRPEWDLVLGLGGQTTVAELGPMSDNVLPLSYAPQLDVLSTADCAINHGGNTSVNECISSGVPMVVYSPSLLDQDGCAARVEYHGLGVLGDWQAPSAADLERHIDLLLNNEEIQTNIHSMRESFDRYESDGIVVKVIEDYLAAGESP